MALVMTDDYAALVVGVDIALLVIGTVEVLGLIRLAVSNSDELIAREDAALKVISDRLRAGEEPTTEELEAAVQAGRPRLALPMLGLIALSLVWVTLSLALVLAVVATIFWSATEDHSSAPLLAWCTAWITSISATVLLVETALKAIGLISKMTTTQLNEPAPPYSEDAAARVEEHRRAQGRPPAQRTQDAQTAGDGPGPAPRPGSG